MLFKAEFSATDFVALKSDAIIIRASVKDKVFDTDLIPEVKASENMAYSFFGKNIPFSPLASSGVTYGLSTSGTLNSSSLLPWSYAKVRKGRNNAKTNRRAKDKINLKHLRCTA